MKKKIFLNAVIPLALLLAALGFILKDRVFQKNIPVISTPSDSEFSLKPNHYDSLGIDSGTSFVLSAKTQDVEEKMIKNSLSIEPEFKYKIKSSDKHKLSIIPKEKLKSNTIYKFSLVTKNANQNRAKKYQWAYQTKSKFKITGTLPANQASHVPYNTGIEINFSHENFKNYEKYFSIIPKTKGKFEKHRNILVFMPESLSKGTLYTITIKKGLPLEGSKATLNKDYTFQFETNAEYSNSGNITFSDKFYEYPTDQTPILTLNWAQLNTTGADVAVYRFKSFSEFTKAVGALNAYPSWAYYSRKKYNYPTNSLDLTAKFKTEIKSGDYKQYIEFPEKMETGYYLVELKNNEQTSQAYLQISDISGSLEGTTQNSFIWAHDLKTSQPLNKAKITFSGNKNFQATTNSNGLAKFAAPIQITTDKYGEIADSYYYTISYKNRKLLIPVINHYEFNYGMGSKNAARNYWAYLYTNRTLYAPTDSIKFWGVAKNRFGKQALKIKAKLTLIGGYLGNGQEMPVKEQDIEVGPYGTFEGIFNYKNLSPGSYSLRITADNKQIANSYIEIRTFAKPSYKIEVTTDKRAIFAGDSITYNIKAVFYDGTPLGNLELEYNGDLGSGKTTTNENGESKITLTSSYSQDYFYFPRSVYFTIHPTQAETANIYTEAYAYLFGPSLEIEASLNKDNYAINGTVYNIDLSKINQTNSGLAWNFKGSPAANRAIKAKIYHEYSTKTKTGTRYDFISKKTYPIYDYQHHSDLEAEQQATTDNQGKFIINYNYQGDKNYKIELSVIDSAGHIATTNIYKYSLVDSYNYYLSQGYDSYSLEISGNEQKIFKPGEEVKAYFYKNEEQLSKAPDNDFVYFKGMAEIFDLTASNQPNYSFKFKESYAPNIYLYGLYFDGREYHLTQAVRLNYDSSLKKLNISIKKNKEKYRPADKVKLDIKVADYQNKPVKAKINISAIDEALTAIQWDNSPDFLSNLYAKLPLPLKYSYQSHRELLSPQAEGGGCFSGSTKILMANGRYKNISDIIVGDEILTRKNPKSKQLAPDKVINTYKHLVNGYLIINRQLKITPEHIIYLNGHWQAAGQAKTGDYLIGTTGQKIIIKTIKKSLKPIWVYNLHTEKYHTFIAGGIYVHNNKGAVRENFQNTAYFGSAETDNNGKTQVNFTLPDNVTSWQTTIHALTKDLKASASQTAIISTLPFFVNASIAQDYLVGDKPTIKIRSFGDKLNPNLPIKYKITYPNFNNQQTAITIKAGQPAEIKLPEFKAGQHSIRIQASQGTNSDTIVKSFTFHDSNILKSNTDYLALAEKINIPGNNNGYTRITFTNQERGQYYRLLKELSWENGDRVEQKLSRYYANKLLKDYFDEKTGSREDFDFTAFQQTDGGISLLPYSSSDILLTAKAMEIAADKFDRQAAEKYFEKILSTQNSNLDEIAYSLFGLANLKEPILTKINIFLENNEISPQLTLYLARAVSNLGATEYAMSLLQPIIDNYGVSADPYIKIELGSNPDKYTEYTYQAAIILTQASSDKAEKLFNFASHNPAAEHLNNLEKISYATYTLPVLSKKPISFTYKLDGQEKKVNLKNDEKLTLTLSNNQLKNISFGDIKGKVGIISSYQTPADLDKIKMDPKISLSREYSVNGQLTTNFKQNDIVKITLSPKISKNVLDNEYQLTDYLPAGLKIITNLRSRNIYQDNETSYPYEINGQEIKFWTGKPAASFHYYAVATSPGSFIAEPATLQGFIVKNSFNHANQAKINID